MSMMLEIFYGLALVGCAGAGVWLGRRRTKRRNQAAIDEELRLMKAASLGQWPRP